MRKRLADKRVAANHVWHILFCASSQVNESHESRAFTGSCRVGYLASTIDVG
jgi:hypothetical protein